MAIESDARVARLAEGFNSLLDEYGALLARSQQLERDLQDAASKLDRFARRGSITKDDLKDLRITSTPIDIESTPRTQGPTEKWWMRTDLKINKRNLLRTRYAVDATQSLGMEKTKADDMCSKMSSEVMPLTASSAMPSIVESLLEKDFTTSGTPSRLDCPFASMSNRRLSAHAASVVSKYRPTGVMTPRSAMSFNHDTKLAPRSPLTINVETTSNALEVNGLNTPDDKGQNEVEASIQGSAPVCPIRFLEKSKPEDVAEYFEKHKHELPRSHEVCVKRYQSDADSVRQLDAKYGNLVSMIQGLGQKHAPMLPGKNEDPVAETQDSATSDRVKNWASGVDTAPPVDTPEDDQGRQSHFDRPMKDVRLGESPSRPWGIQVPLSVLEKSTEGVKPNEESTPGERPAAAEPDSQRAAKAAGPAGKCPFARGAPPGMANPHEAKPVPETVEQAQKDARPVFLAGQGGDSARPGHIPGMTFTGPVFIGYTPEQAVEVLRMIDDR